MEKAANSFKAEDAFAIKKKHFHIIIPFPMEISLPDLLTNQVQTAVVLNLSLILGGFVMMVHNPCLFSSISPRLKHQKLPQNRNVLPPKWKLQHFTAQNHSKRHQRLIAYYKKMLG